MQNILRLRAALALCLLLSPKLLAIEPFDAAPFGLPLPEGQGLQWTDPREIHQVTVHFAAPPPPADQIRLEYWTSRWPDQRIPKDVEPGGGSVGWMELGNWYSYKWRAADTEARAEGQAVTFSFHPVHAREYPNATNLPALPIETQVFKFPSNSPNYRFTLRIRVTSDQPLPAIERFEVLTDSTLEPRAVNLAWKTAPTNAVECDVFNGRALALEQLPPRGRRLRLLAAKNADPNTFDRTLVTVRTGPAAFTFAVSDLTNGALYLPHLGVAVLPENDRRSYAAVAAAQQAAGGKTLYQRVAERPEQTWKAAWAGMPAKRTHIYLPLGLDGGRQRFQLDADGTVRYRSNDSYLNRRAGRDTPRFVFENGSARFRFLPTGTTPVARTIEESSLPIGHTTWETNGVRIQHTAFAADLEGTRAQGPVPPGDQTTVFMARFALTNTAAEPRTFSLPVTYKSGPVLVTLRHDGQGGLWLSNYLRAQFLADVAPVAEAETLRWTWQLPPGGHGSLVVKIPYVVLTNETEHAALARLDFDREHRAVADYWRRRLDEGAVLTTPEPMLNEFYRAHTGHLLINCESDPDSSDRRLARVGSFVYGVYGNEACMMVVDLDRRGYHREAQQCLDAWLHYQGTAALPGDFSTKEGVLYGAGGVEEGGYNQHHGWILWMLAEHYRFTRDQAWLKKAAPGILAGAEWIIRETHRTAGRHPLERGLLPAGSLEDIGDWWTWLSTSCYTWRGLDAAAWALQQAGHPEAARVRREASAFHTALLNNFRQASDLSPVVRLRNGIAVPHTPSMVHRRGRYFGWICETLEGSMHLLISGALSARSPEADWILNDYEDNRYISNQYGYLLDDFEAHWFGRGGMSMQACLLFHVEPYLYRDDIKHALRGLFNAQAASYYPDVRMNTEHALPHLGDWAGDHYKSSDEANATGWLRHLFLREDGDTLLVGQAIPREWLQAGQKCALERGGTWFGPASITYTGGNKEITARLEAPRRNPPQAIKLRFRQPDGRPFRRVTVNGQAWKKTEGDWVLLPGDIGAATIQAKY